MLLSPTLFSYFGKHFLAYVLGTFVVVMAIIFLFDVAELLRRGVSKEGISLSLILEMAILKAPNVGYKILPFAVLFGSMMAFINIVRNRELVAAHSAGITVWQVLLPAITAVLFLGLFWVMIINPVSSLLTAKFEMLENQILRNQGNALSVSPGGLWIREKNGKGHSVLHARDISNDGETLSNVTIFLFEKEDAFISRIDATEAKLKPGYWELKNTVEISENGVAEEKNLINLTTQLTINNIQDSFASPSTMSFWDLPEFINILEEAGFTAVRHRLHWHALLASPVLLCAMVLIAAAFSLRTSTRVGSKTWVLAGLFFGFFLYFMTDLVFALGLSSRIPEALAAWTPAIVTMLIGITSLLHLEDG